MQAKTVGVSKLVVVVNKMDEPSVQWAQERFDEIVTKLTPFLKSCGCVMTATQLYS
jgi:peptide chain release factor subunit 3